MGHCVILGGNGFLGSNLARGLLLKGHSVRVFCSINSQLNNLKDIIHNIDIIRGNFLSETDIREALAGIDYVFHYISTTTPASSIHDPIFDVQTNIIGSLQLFQIARDMRVKKIIFPSSGGTIYGDCTDDLIHEDHPINPQNPYAISKSTIEHYLRYFHRLYGLPYLILRYSNPYGEGQNPRGKQGVIPIFINKIKKNEILTIFGDGSAVRDYIYIKDAIDATISIFETDSIPSIYNVGSGVGTTLHEIIDILSHLAEKEIAPRYVEDSDVYLKRVVLDISKIHTATGWSPQTSIREGITKTWKYLYVQDMNDED
jgi:UDP-glucose 4-epimerase